MNASDEKWLASAMRAIQAAGEGKNRSAAARAAGVTRETLAIWLRRTDQPRFIALQQAYRRAEDRWEQRCVDALAVQLEAEEAARRRQG